MLHKARSSFFLLRNKDWLLFSSRRVFF
jgi:hypothetical protein